MTTDFQSSLLKYLFQDKAAKKYRDLLDASAFDEPTLQLIFGFWHKYVTKYNSTPVKHDFLEYVCRIKDKAKGLLTNEVYRELLSAIAVAYMPDTTDTVFVHEIIVEYAKRKKFRNWMTKNAEKIKSADSEELDEMYHSLAPVMRLGLDDAEEARNSGGSLIYDEDFGEALIKGAPTFLHGINKTTASYGFYSPQLILLLGGPKAFKTGTLISIVLGYLRDGKKIFLADAENGLTAIRSRLKQGLLECEQHEISTFSYELQQIRRWISLYGGDIQTHFFPAGSTLDNVDAVLDKLYSEKKFKPDIILYDPLYLFNPVDKRIFDQRLKIQAVFHHAIRLNNKWGCFSFAAGKVKQEAVNKLHIKVAEVFAEDFGQAYNSHASFILLRTEQEERNGTGRVCPIMQRTGVGYKGNAATTCAMKIDPEKQLITELDADVYMEVLSETYQPEKKDGPIKRRFTGGTIHDE